MLYHLSHSETCSSMRYHTVISNRQFCLHLFQVSVYQLYNLGNLSFLNLTNCDYQRIQTRFSLIKLELDVDYYFGLSYLLLIQPLCNFFIKKFNPNSNIFFIIIFLINFKIILLLIFKINRIFLILLILLNFLCNFKN